LLHETVGNRISKSLLQQVKELHDWISMGLDRVVPDAEVYHSFHPQSELLPILHHAIQNQRPLFLTLPDDPEFPLDPGSLGVQKTNLKVRFEYEVLKVALAYSPRIWIQREEQREILHGLGIRPDRIRTAPFGLSRGIMEVDSFTSPRRMRSRLGIGVLGPLHPAADFRTVFAAFAEVPHKSIGPKLTIFADPSDNPTYWQEILFTAQSVGVQNAFVLQSPDNLAHHIHSIDILVLPSLVKSNYREVLFCWRNRVIPLVPRVSWARNLLDDTDWSTYNPYDYRNLATQITRLAEDPYRARNLAEENAKRSRDHYAPGQVIREYAKAYRQEVTAPSLAFLPRVANFQLDRRF